MLAEELRLILFTKTIRHYLILLLSFLCTFLCSFLTHAQNTSSRPLIVYVHDSFYYCMKDILDAYQEAPVVYKPLSGHHLVWALKRGGQGGAALKADIILGLETEKIYESAIQEISAPLDEDLYHDLHLPFEWRYKTILPVTYAYYAFLTHTPNAQSYQTLSEFLEAQPDQSLIVADPRTSMVGRALLTWLAPDLLPLLHQKVRTYPSGWSGCFALFNQQQGQTMHQKTMQGPTMLGYSTSILYYRDKNMKEIHWISLAKAPHPITVQGAIKIKKTKSHPKIQSYLKFLLSPKVQSKLMARNYSYPVTSITVTPEAEACRPALGFLLESNPPAMQHLIQAWFKAGYSQ